MRRDRLEGSLAFLRSDCKRVSFTMRIQIDRGTRDTCLAETPTPSIHGKNVLRERTPPHAYPHQKGTVCGVLLTAALLHAPAQSCSLFATAVVLQKTCAPRRRIVCLDLALALPRTEAHKPFCMSLGGARRLGEGALVFMYA